MSDFDGIGTPRQYPKVESFGLAPRMNDGVEGESNMHTGHISHEGIAHEVRMGRDPRNYVPPTEDFDFLSAANSSAIIHEDNYGGYWFDKAFQ